MHTLKIYWQLLLGDFKREKVLTILSILGISLGVSLFISVNIATNRAIDTFKKDVYSLSKGYNYEIVSYVNRYIPNEIYKRLAKITYKISPVVTIGAVAQDKNESYLKIYGIDIFLIKKDDIFNDIEGNLAEFFKNRNSVLISVNFAKSHDVSLGDTFDIVVSDKSYNLKVAGVYRSDVLPNNFLLMDIGNLQETFNLFGLSRIDISVNDQDKISNTLPDNLLLLEKKEVLSKKKGIIKSFTYNLKFISYVAILVGLFILYNSIFVSVVRSRPNIGILRCLGFKRNSILWFYVLKGLILGIIGSLVGIFFAQFLSFFSISMAEKTISTIYTPIRVYDVFLSIKEFLWAILVGVTLSIIAAIIPAYEAAKAKPIEATLPNIVEINYASLYRLAFIFGVSLVSFGLFISIYEYISKPFNYPFLSYIGVFLIIFGFTFIAPLYLKCVLKVIEKFVKITFKFVGVVATGDIRGSLHRFSVALISVMISSALIISFFILIYSFEKNLTDWIDRNLNFDIFIKASSCSSNFCFTPLSKKLIDILENFDEVEDVNKFRVMRGYYKNRPVLLGFGNEEVVKKHTDHVVKLGIRKKKELAASEYFRIKYGIKAGDYMKISTPKGEIKFKVREIFKSYSTTSGFLVFDRYWLKKLWSLDDATQLNIYLKKGVSTKEFIDKLKSNIPKNINVDIYDNKNLKKRVLQIFDRTFAITYAIQIIAFLISLIGMINTIFTVIVEKLRSISILRYLGCSYKKIKLIFITAASIVGFAGIIIGALLGAIISFIMIKIVNIVSFGWTIDIFVPFASILGLLLLLYLTIVISVFLPISYIKKIDVKESINI